MRGQIDNLFSLSGLMAGQFDRVTRQLKESLTGVSEHEGLRKGCLLWSLSCTHYIAGDLQAASRHAATMRKSAELSGIGNFSAWSDYLDGLVHLQRGDLRGAIEQLEKAAERKYLIFARAAADALGALAVAYHANGQPDRATTTLRTLEQYTTDLELPFADLADTCAARIALMSGGHESALDWLKGSESPSANGMMNWFVQPCVIRCRALLAENSVEGLAEAEVRLLELADRNRAHHNTCQLIGILSLLAVVCAALRKRDEAFSTLDNALLLARPGGFIFPFVELGLPMAELLQQAPKQKGHAAQIERILAEFPKLEEVGTQAPPPSPAQDQPLIEPLTNRELDVLELLAKRMYDKEIAETLSVSVGTVKTHLKHIYSKLGASGRRQAVMSAEALGILKH